MSRARFGLRGKTALSLSGLLFMVLLVSSYTSYWQAKSIAMQNEQDKLIALKERIEQGLQSDRNNLMALRDVPPITAIIRARMHQGIDPENGDTLQLWRQRLAVIFRAFLLNHPQFFQIRYIDVEGNELVRGERGVSGVVRITAEDALQDKSGTDYVRQTLKLKEGQIYLSDVTLYREQGKIQLPHTPVLRMATPAFDSDGHTIGLIVINIFSDQLFSMIQSEANGTRRHIANDRGYFIKHSDAAKTFAWELGKHDRLSDVEPEMAAIASRQDQFIRFDTNHGELDGFQRIYFSPGQHNRYWLLILHVPRDVVFSANASMFKGMVLISFIICTLLFFLILSFVSRKIVRPVVRLAEATRALQAGDLTMRVDAVSAEDELRTLYEAINDFAEKQQYATEKLEREVALQTDKLAAVIDNIVDGIITITADGSIESFNASARALFGYADDEVLGRNVKMLMPEPYHSEHDGYLHHYMTTGEKKVIDTGREATGLRTDGSTFPMDLAISEVMIDSVRRFVGITRDISERKQAEEKIRDMAHFDHLTRLPNRALFHDRLTQSLTLAHRNGSQLALMFIDLDGFKEINDSLGHEAGDLLLQTVAARLLGSVREVDTVARLGGDEFAVILPALQAAGNAAEKAALIIANVSAPYPEIDSKCTIGCSIGISLFPGDADTCKALLSKADIAMYAVKNSGKNHFCFYQDVDG